MIHWERAPRPLCIGEKNGIIKDGYGARDGR